MPDTIPATTNARQDQLKILLRNPTTRLLMLLVGVAMAVALGVGIVLWSRGPNYALLYAGLDPKDAAAVLVRMAHPFPCPPMCWPRRACASPARACRKAVRPARRCRKAIRRSA